MIKLTIMHSNYGHNLFFQQPSYETRFDENIKSNRKTSQCNDII